jgi:hypothetical protein
MSMHMISNALRLTLVPLIFAASACHDAAEPSGEAHGAQTSVEQPDGPIPTDPLAHLPRGDAQRERLCSRDGDDLLRAALCADEPWRPRSIVDVQKALYIDEPRLSGVNGFAMTGHSTSLGSRSISAINPRMIAVRVEHPVFDDQLNGAAPGSQGGALVPSLEPVAVAFARGEQFMELMLRDRIDHELRFYLLLFRQACNDSEAGCKPGDLLTPEIEKNWLETSLYDERDLADTVLDCAPCHQTNGPGSSKFLRMQELREPWTHWFGQQTEGGRALLEDYRAAKADEEAFGLSGQAVMRTNPVSLELQAIYGGPNSQPNPFDSQKIEAEVQESAAALGGMQPQDNSVPGDSETWRAGYDAARRGEAMTFPYHDVKVTDPDKLAQMTEAYRAYRDGELDRSELPDIREVFPDDPQRLAEMGFTTKPGASGEEVLLEACSLCHNNRLDQSLSRARFRANLEGLTRNEKDAAIRRLRLPAADVRHMPPTRLRFLSDEARARAIEVLRR